MATDKREHPRLLKRIRLRYRSDNDRWRSAFSKDISTTGLYIITNNVPTTREIEIEIVDAANPISMRGTILRGKKVPPRLRGAVTGGIAVSLVDAPDTWCRFCLDLEEKLRARGASSSSRFIQVTTDVADPET